MRNPNPFFTIIIPTLNEETHLPLLLEDLTRQTFTDFQVTVVDGFSTDCTINKARQFSHHLTLTIKQTPFRNVSFQRNFGAQQSSSPYLVFFDADTRLPLNYLAQVHQYLTTNPVDVLSTWIIPSEDQLKTQLIANTINYILEIYKYFTPLAWGSHLIINRIAFMNSAGFNPQITFGEDAALTQKIIQQGGTYALLKSPRAIFSFRRFNRGGHALTSVQLIILYLHYLINDPTKPPPFTYPMGGTSEKSHLQLRHLKKIQKQLTTLNQLSKTRLKSHPEIQSLINELHQQWLKIKNYSNLIQ